MKKRDNKKLFAVKCIFWAIKESNLITMKLFIILKKNKLFSLFLKKKKKLLFSCNLVRKKIGREY